MSPPTSVNPSCPARNLRSSDKSTPSTLAGMNPPDPASTMAPPPSIPWDGATTQAPPHRKDQPTASSTEDSPLTLASGPKTTPMTLATITTSLAKGTPSTNPFAELDNDSTGQHKGTTDDDASARNNGGSQPLLDNDTPTKDARSQSLPVNVTPPEDTPGDTTATSWLQDAFAEHDRVMTSAIADVYTTATMPNAATHTTATAHDGMAQTVTTLVTTMPATTNPTLADLMAFMERSFSQSRADSCAIRDCLDAVDANNKILCAAIGAKADSAKIARLDS
jgi:hypothetical protein